MVYPVSTVRVILRPVLKIELPRKGQTKENKQNGSTQLTRIKQHSIFTEKSCDQQLAATAREHIHPWQSRETTSLCFQNVDGDVPSEMTKLKGEGEKVSRHSRTHQSLSLVNNQVLWARSTR